ncbi:MAG: 16S rRNA processing protein RimM [Bacteroidaceae bacterium]|nr:16S rRNA processing protein RimM [Bacteroidaceae bacterium]
MIELHEVQRMGYVLKTHGVNGELVVSVPADMDWSEDTDYLVCSMDGILVPFFIESIRGKSSTNILVKFDDIDSVEQARKFQGVVVYLPNEYVENNLDQMSWSTFIDYKVEDAVAGYLGDIVAVDDSTMNVLFLVKQGDRERVIPANDVWIESIDSVNRVIKYNLPEGVAEL